MQNLNILFSDDYLMVIDKPAGLVVTPAESVKVETLSDILIRDFNIQIDRGGVVHRLDKDTSGILLIAKTQQSLEQLQFQFKERMVKKEYLALSHGFLEKEETVSGSIERNPKNREKFIVTQEGKEAETKFAPIQMYKLSEDKMEELFTSQFNKIQRRKLERTNYGIFTLVRCFPLTGRTHQIRVHLKYLGFPIVGDEKYAGRKTARLDGRWCQRQFLHAAKITFYHPQNGETMIFESSLPDDLQKVMTNLEHI
jgi:23S rRNA pseudouridine1911/1915/1917 synthase